MATQQPELFSSAAGIGSGLRVEPKTVQPRKFGTTVGGVLLKKLTPVALNTTTKKWAPFDESGSANGTNIIRGFVYPDEIDTDATDDVIGQVLLEGKVHFDDLPVYNTVDLDATVAGWNAALRDAHTFGLIVEGIPGT